MNPAVKYFVKKDNYNLSFKHLPPGACLFGISQGVKSGHGRTFDNQKSCLWQVNTMFMILLFSCFIGACVMAIETAVSTHKYKSYSVLIDAVNNPK